jgi:hypothetical protein
MKVEIFKDAWINKSLTWRAKVTFDDGKNFTTGMHKTKKSLLAPFSGNNITVIRRKDLDCK